MFDTNLSDRRLADTERNLSQKCEITIKTCADVYNHWRGCKRLYKKAPEDGVEFQVEYIDTYSALPDDIRTTAPIALVLHGAPGSYQDFTLLINHLTNQNVRVIAPNFPEYTATVKTKVLFRHSADEKAAYLRDFLKAINVTKIDLLVSHSSAIFPALLILTRAAKRNLERSMRQQETHNDNIVRKQLENLALGTSEQPEPLDDDDKFEDALEDLDSNNNFKQAELIKRRIERKVNRKRLLKSKKSNQEIIVKFEEPIEIRAVALFNPAGHRLPKSMKPLWFKCGSVRIYQHKIGRYWFRKLGPAGLTIIGVPVRVDNMDNVMLSATVMRNSKCQRLVNQLEQLSQLKMPTLLVFSENDKLIEKEIFYEMSQLMRLDPESFDIFDNGGEIERSRSREGDWIRVMVFKAGGHYAYSNYAKIVNKAVSELLDRALKKSQDKETGESC